jgi:hypothetical protein
VLLGCGHGLRAFEAHPSESTGARRGAPVFACASA